MDTDAKMEPKDQQDDEPHLYNFRWREHPQSVVSTFKSLRDEEDFIDVTLACNSRQFNAHKVVLSACSPYFRKLLKVSKKCLTPDFICAIGNRVEEELILFYDVSLIIVPSTSSI